jgi:DNA-binding MarR family transcriptional regulator
MEDLRSILTHHHSKKQIDKSSPEKESHPRKATTSEIPDLFFDDILVNYKLVRVDVLVLMYIYRVVWCRPNIHKDFGISPVLSYSDIANNLEVAIDQVHQSLRKLETLEFIETIRAGQYFVRKYFTKENDYLYGMHYDDFL